MRSLIRRRRTRYACRRHHIPLTALCLAAACLLLHGAGFSPALEQALARLGAGLYHAFSPENPLPDLPATDSPTLSLPGFSIEDLFSTFEPDDSDDSASPLPTPPASGGTGGNALPVTITGGGNSFDPGRVYIKNLTSYAIDTLALLQAKNPVSIKKSSPDLPQVLIVHTHGTEAFTPDGTDTYTPSGSYRTLDSEQNMLRIGEEVAALLNSRGIGTVHSTALHDYPAYNGAYSRALTDIKAWLKKYPSIKLVIDLHRDALMDGDTVYKTIAPLEGKSCAQLMLVTGTDGGSLSHPNWKKNAAFQAQLHHKLNTAYPGIMRPMSFRAGRYNQHLTTGSMLVEVGTCGNTLQEALAAARIFADSLADMLLAH